MAVSLCLGCAEPMGLFELQRPLEMCSDECGQSGPWIPEGRVGGQSDHPTRLPGAMAGQRSECRLEDPGLILQPL